MQANEQCIDVNGYIVHKQYRDYNANQLESRGRELQELFENSYLPTNNWTNETRSITFKFISHGTVCSSRHNR